ncbi:hypothetical protein [Thermocoleostomius sinensis]|jgi:hypothetical protein|uniref:Uncharacterized protein n=1 Tax=Thermocoleostomius sinensis A174 TaxID=2016057 RepID=A0A9E9CAL8_9CYAN|nr:hypothetical protein [Thermocoleostomius sinensis]WAL59105.1 hypothetical protein OXH18_18280 [Thermocoleostomius sinensis A174]
MSDKPDRSSFKKILAAICMGFLTYLFFPVASSVISAYFNQDARFDPQRSQNPTTLPSSPTETARLPTPQETIQTPPPTPIQTPKPEPTISGEWEGKYICSKRITGVTVAMAQTGNKVIADFVLYPPRENSDIPRGVERYDGRSGSARYQGDFNPTSRLINFPRGTWREQPAPFWTAFGFHGEFDENLETFSGRMDHHSCTTINLTKKDD